MLSPSWKIPKNFFKSLGKIGSGRGGGLTPANYSNCFIISKKIHEKIKKTLSNKCQANIVIKNEEFVLLVFSLFLKLWCLSHSRLNYKIYYIKFSQEKNNN